MTITGNQGNLFPLSFFSWQKAVSRYRLRFSRNRHEKGGPLKKNYLSFFSSDDEDKKMEFVKEISDINPAENELCHFVCEINHRPPSHAFYWFLNDIKISKSDLDIGLEMTFIDHDTHACAIIAAVSERHAGRWVCQIGSTSTSANLTLLRVNPGELSSGDSHM